MQVRMYSSFIVGICMLFIMKILFWLYQVSKINLIQCQGVAVARLPIIPVGLLANFTHTSLEGEDYSLGSGAFLYILALCSLRNPIKKMFGFKRPRTRDPITLTFPAKLFCPRKSEFWWQSPKMISLFMAGFYGYSLYKVIRKH